MREALGQRWLPSRNMTPLQREYLITLALLRHPNATYASVQIDVSAYRPILIVYLADGTMTTELGRYRGDKYGVLRNWEAGWRNITNCWQLVDGQRCRLLIDHAGDHDPNDPSVNDPNTEESE